METLTLSTTRTVPPVNSAATLRATSAVPLTEPASVIHTDSGKCPARKPIVRSMSPRGGVAVCALSPWSSIARHSQSAGSPNSSR